MNILRQEMNDKEVCSVMKKISIQVRHHDRCVHGKLYTPDSSGRHPLIIFSHGYNGRMDDFEKSAEFFTAQGFVSVTLAFCGAGSTDLSEFPSTSLSVLTMTEDLTAVLDEVSARDDVDPERIFLFGGSQGGLVSALTAAQQTGRIAGLILLFPALCIEDNWAEKFEKIEDMPEEYDFWGLTLGRAYARGVRGLNTYDKIIRYTGPVLIMHGSDDEIVPFSYSSRAQSLYQNARLICFEQEHHGFAEDNDRRMEGIAYSFAKEVLDRC